MDFWSDRKFRAEKAAISILPYGSCKLNNQRLVWPPRQTLLYPAYYNSKACINQIIKMQAQLVWFWEKDWKSTNGSLILGLGQMATQQVAGRVQPRGLRITDHQPVSSNFAASWFPPLARRFRAWDDPEHKKFLVHLRPCRLRHHESEARPCRSFAQTQTRSSISNYRIDHQGQNSL
jgi:hypothetical protein